jgi:hypothetical protein
VSSSPAAFARLVVDSHRVDIRFVQNGMNAVNGGKRR